MAFMKDILTRNIPISLVQTVCFVRAFFILEKFWIF